MATECPDPPSDRFHRGTAPVRGLPVSRILLVGFMASGKSSVGREVAHLLGWPFLDFDEEIRRRSGEDASAIFARAGEAGFREAEAWVAGQALLEESVVLASGGGWAAQPGNMEKLADDTFTVWLKVTPATALRRASAQGVVRPLLEGARPDRIAERLLAEREPFYRLARLTLDSEGVSVPMLAHSIVQCIHRYRGPADTALAETHEDQP